MMQPKLGIVAGGGHLPELIISACQKSNRDYFVIALKGHTSPDLIQNVPHMWMRLGATGSAIKKLKSENVRDIVMAGHVKRPSVFEIFPDFFTIKFFLKARVNSSGDDTFLRAIIHMLEREHGFNVVGPETLISDLLTPEGCLTSAALTPDNLRDVKFAVKSALDLGRDDIGQACIVRHGKVVGLEDKSGTDALLLKVSQNTNDEPRDGVLVKMAKPQQETRVDLPTIGMNTVEGAFKAGLSGIAIEAGRSFILDRENVLQKANELGMFVIGVKAP